MSQPETLITTPERNLLAAILRRALFDFSSGDLEERIAAKEWFLAGANQKPFSFAWVCLQLNLEPEAILLRIRARRSPFGQSKQTAHQKPLAQSTC